jgi:hypothetical protein
MLVQGKKEKGWDQDKARKSLLRIWVMKRKHYGGSPEYIFKLNTSSPKLKFKTQTQKTYTLNLFIKSNCEFKSKT